MLVHRTEAWVNQKKKYAQRHLEVQDSMVLGESSWREQRTRRGISQKDKYNWPITWWDNTLKYQQMFLNWYLLSPFALPSLHLNSLVFHTDGLKEMVVWLDRWSLWQPHDPSHVPACHRAAQRCLCPKGGLRNGEVGCQNWKLLLERNKGHLDMFLSLIPQGPMIKDQVNRWPSHSNTY